MSHLPSYFNSAGEDYDGQQQVVEIPPSLTPSETCFEVEIIDDSEVENNEEFLVSFEIVSGSSAVPGDVGSTCVTITDNDEGISNII